MSRCTRPWFANAIRLHPYRHSPAPTSSPPYTNTNSMKATTDRVSAPRNDGNGTLATSTISHNAGPFGLWPSDLFHHVFSRFLPSAIDQLALGRSCRWLHEMVQQTAAWKLLFSPLSPYARFARPVIGPFSKQFTLPTPLQLDLPDVTLHHRQVVCLRIGRLSPVFSAWVAKEQPGLHFDDAIFAGTLQVLSSKVLPRRSPPCRPNNVFHDRCDPEFGCSVCHDELVRSDSLFLPLFLDTDHFESAFSLLQGQLSCAIADPATASRFQSEEVRGNRPSIPYTMVTTYFSHLVRNMAARFVLSACAPTVNDLEVFAQVLALWRAVLQRFGLNGPSWIVNKIHGHVNNLKRGGKHARQVPLMELVSLLHMSTDKELTWPKVFNRIVEENTIRLFEFVRACSGCSTKLREPGFDKIADSSLWFCNEIARLQTDGYGFVPWPIFLFHFRIMRATSAIPPMVALSSFGQLLGTLEGGERLVPGKLARELHSHLVQNIRPFAGKCRSWSDIWLGLGASPMDHDALTKWLDWCDTQVKCRTFKVNRLGKDTHGYRRRCAVCPDTGAPQRAPWYAPRPRPVDSVTVTFDPNYLDYHGQPRFTDHVPPEFSFIALSRHGALVGVHSQIHAMDGIRCGLFPTDSVSIDTRSLRTTLNVASLDASVAFVAVVTTDWDSRSTVTAEPGSMAGPSWDSVCGSACKYARNSHDQPKGLTARLSWVCCRGLDDGRWYLVRATSVPRPGQAAHSFGHHTWMVEPGSWPLGNAAGKGTEVPREVGSAVDHVDLAQRWVVEYIRFCQVNGLNVHCVNVSDLHRFESD